MDPTYSHHMCMRQRRCRYSKLGWESMSAYAQTKSLGMARMAGLEPAAAALTVRSPTIGRHPNGWRESDSNRRPAAYEAAAGNHSSQSRLFANQYINLNAFHPKTLHISHFFCLRLPLREPSMANDAHSPRRNPELPRDFHRGASARSTGLEDRPRAIRTTPANHGART